MRFVRSANRSRRRYHLALGGCVLAIGLVLVLLGYASLRRFVAERIGQETKHQVIALISLPLNPPPETADLTPIAHADVPPYAINVFLEQEVEEWKIRESLRLIQQAGFRFVKQQLVWGAIEAPAKGRYEDPNAPNRDAWAKYDRIVDLAAEYGLQVIFRIDTSPDWARLGNTKLETPPDNPEDFGDFVATAVQRYRGRVHYYQIWNEPNLAFEWGGNPPDAREYVALLEAAYRRAKAVDPDVVIISAALAPTIEQSERGLSDTIYLQQMYDAGAAAFFDVLGVNAYGLRHGPDDRRLGLATDVNFSRPVLLRALMVRNGDAAKPIWASEIGWVALPPGFPEEPRYGQVTRETQARYTVRAYRRAQEEWPWMAVMALWHFRLIHPHDRVQQHYYFNVVDEEFRPYPVYEAMRALVAESPVLHRGYHKPTHWAIAAEGNWTVQADPNASLGKTLIGQPGAVLRFTFEGSRLQVAVNRGVDSGRLAVRIDGETPLLPGVGRRDDLPAVDSGAAEYGHPAVATVFDTPAVPPMGRHEVELRVVDGPVALDGVIVNGPTPYQAFVYAAVRFVVALGVVGWWLIGWYVRGRKKREAMVIGPATGESLCESRSGGGGKIEHPSEVAPAVGAASIGRPLGQTETPRVSVVATVLNEEKSIGLLVESLLAQTRPPDEIVLVDGGSRDGTVATIERYVADGAPIRLIVAPGANISVGRNRGIAAASHDLIAVTDAGVRLASNWLEKLIAPFLTADGAAVDVSSGFFHAAPSTTFELALGATTLPLVDEIDPRRFLPSSRSVAFRRAVWETIGGYPEWLDYCEDLVFDLALRDAGARFAFAPEAIAHFRPRPDLRAFFLQYYRYARGDGKADLWRRRHAIRYASYSVGALALLLGFWYKGLWLGLLAAASAHLYQPYRRLWLFAWKWPRRTLLPAIALVPVIRVVGDVAKMLGYPVGIWWRLSHGRRGDPSA